MRRAIAVLALVPFLAAAGCGKTLIATGGLITTVGIVAVGIPEEESSGCTDGPGCVDYDLDGGEGQFLVTGLVLMGVGAVINVLENRGSHHRAPRARAPQPIVVMEPASSADATGRWREVPPGPED